MEKSEAYKLVYTMREAYMATYMNLSEDAFRGMADVWYSVLKDYSYEDSYRGLRLFLARDTKGFPPSPGQVIDMIHQLNPARPEMSASEAWSYVRRAIEDSGYHSVERYAALPPICREIVSSPHSLEVMGQMSSDDVENIQKSHFIRAYNTLIERKKRRR